MGTQQKTEGLTIKEALESGHRFRRKGSTEVFPRRSEMEEPVKLLVEEILSTDWEIIIDPLRLSFICEWRKRSTADDSAVVPHGNIPHPDGWDALIDKKTRITIEEIT